MRFVKWSAYGLLVLIGMSMLAVAAKVVLFPAMVATTAINSAGGGG